MLNVVVLVSGGGTNLQAILDRSAEGKLPLVRIAAVISNNHGAYALERAKNAGVPGECVSPADFENREKFYDALMERIAYYKADLIVLAGYLVVIPEKMVDAYPNRIINVHPSLIPSFCGTGYYGLKVHESALARGVKVTGATVHFVDKGTDTGPIILQKAVEVKTGDTPKELQQRVMREAEWVILPEAIRLISEGKITVEDGLARQAE